MKIQLVGGVDKRLVAYPLLKLVTTLGNALVITDDGAYKRFSPLYEEDYTYFTTDFVIVPTVTQEVVDKLLSKKVKYNYVIVISTNEELEDFNHTVRFAYGLNERYFKTLEDKWFDREDDVVFVTNGKIDYPYMIGKITPKPKLLEYITDCEYQRTFLPTESGEMLTWVCDLFGKQLDISDVEIERALRKEARA